MYFCLSNLECSVSVTSKISNLAFTRQVREHPLTVLGSWLEALKWHCAHYILTKLALRYHWFYEKRVLILFGLAWGLFKYLLELFLIELITMLGLSFSAYLVTKNSSGLIDGTRYSTTLYRNTNRWLVLSDGPTFLGPWSWNFNCYGGHFENSQPATIEEYP